MRGSVRPYALCLALTGCAAAPPLPAARLIPGPTGLEVAGTGQQIGLGRAHAGAVAAVSRIKGAPAAEAETAGCTAARWPDGLTLFFREGALIGWVFDGVPQHDRCPPSA